MAPARGREARRAGYRILRRQVPPEAVDAALKNVYDHLRPLSRR